MTIFSVQAENNNMENTDKQYITFFFISVQY